MSTIAKRKASKRPNFPLPRLISAKDFEPIADLQRFREAVREPIRQMINSSLEDIRRSMSESRSTPREEMKQVKALINHLEGLSARVRRLQPGTRLRVNNETGSLLATVLSPEGVRRALPATAKRLEAQFERLRTIADTDEESWRFSARTSATDLFSEIVELIADRLREAGNRYKKSSAAKGGGSPNVYRQQLIRTLAEIFLALRLIPKTTKNGKFLHFVTDVLHAVGWPITGVEDAIREVPGIRLWCEITTEDARWDAARDEWYEREGDLERDDDRGWDQSC
jgi:hypothetical protein